MIEFFKTLKADHPRFFGVTTVCFFSLLLLPLLSNVGQHDLKATETKTNVSEKGVAAPLVKVSIPPLETVEVPNFIGLTVTDCVFETITKDIDLMYVNEDGEEVVENSDDEVVAQSIPEGNPLFVGDSVSLTVKQKKAKKEILSTFEDVDWSSKYYSFNPDGVNGSPNVCDASNNVAWPYSDCKNLSNTGGWNKMICSAYGSSRFWEVNYPDSAYPLPRTWIVDLQNKSKTSSGEFQIVRDISQAKDGSIIGLKIPRGNHVAFLEHVEEGKIVITEANLSKQGNEYGWRRWEGTDIQEWVNYFGAGSSINGYLLPNL